MTNEELYNLLQTTRLDVAYHHFEDKKTPPFLIYENDVPETFKADDIVYSKTDKFIVYLITDKKDIEQEQQLEKLFDDNHIPYEKDEDYIETEKIYQIMYSI